MQADVLQKCFSILNKQEVLQIQHLQEVSRRKSFVPQKIIASIGCDDFDDWAALFQMIALTKLGLLEPIAFVVGLQGAMYRARAIKGLLKHFGLPDISVIVGSDRTSRPLREIRNLALADPHFLADDYEVITDRMGGLLLAIEGATKRNKSIKLLGLASFTDFAEFSYKYEDVFAHQVSDVILMSGYEQSQQSSDKRIYPNTIAMNNMFDIHSTKLLFRKAQEDSVLTIVTREAAYGTNFSPEIIQDIEVFGVHHEIPRFAANIAKDLLQTLWTDIIDGEHPRDEKWFYDVFTDGVSPFEGDLSDVKKKFHPMMQYVKRIIPYDMLPVLCALDKSISSELFEPLIMPGTKARIIGVSKDESNLKKSKKFQLESLLSALIKLPLLELLHHNQKI